jgi:hypothetical protein
MGSAMPEEFLRSWVTTYVTRARITDRPAEPKQLAAICKADAIAAGIDPDELDKAAGGDLVHYIQVAVDKAAIGRMLERRGLKMARGPKGQKRPDDVIGNALKVMRIAAGEEDDVVDDGKDPAAKSLGSRGGKARARVLSPKRKAENRSESGQRQMESVF